MKIRTRLLLFFLPLLLGGIALIALVMAFSWYSSEFFDYLLLGCSVSLTLFLMISTLYFLANKISRPIQKLNNSALAIAAGQYGESIEVDGPKEIAELANTLNTMSECLHENINRLKENARLREERYGEYECSILLQHLMLQKNIEQCRSDAVAIKPITFFSSRPRGVLLQFPKMENPQQFQVELTEAREEGLEGMYQLLTQSAVSAKHRLLFDRSSSTIQSRGLKPLIWSCEKQRFLEGSVAKVEAGDLFFLFNRGLLTFYKEPEKISSLLAKVLKIFAEEGLETSVSMLQKELSFAIKRKELEEDIHLLAFQLLNSSDN